MGAIKEVLFELQTIINNQFPQLFEDDRSEKEFALLDIAGSLFGRDYEQSALDLYDYYSDYTDEDNESILKAIDSVLEEARAFNRKLLTRSKRFQVIRDHIVEIIEIDGLVVHRYSDDGIDSHISLWDLNESDFADFLNDIEILGSFDTLQEAVDYASTL